MKPYIICHLISLLDGRIDCDVTEKIETGDEYYDALNLLDCSSTLMGRVTMQMHYASAEPFEVQNNQSIGEENFNVAIQTRGYIIAIDTMGKLKWPHNQFDGMPLLVITSEDCPKEYLDTLTKQYISWIAVGKGSIDLKRAMEILRAEFGVERLSVTGGGNINAAFLKEGLLDEVSMMWCPGIDGRGGMIAAFDGLPKDFPPTKLKLVSVEKLGETIWARYKVINDFKSKIIISIYTESGTKITSSHRSSNGFVYSGYDYRKPIVYSSLPFEISEKNAIRIKEKLQSYRWEKDFKPDWGISFGRPYNYFDDSNTKDFTDFLNSLHIPETCFQADEYDENNIDDDSVDACLLDITEKEIFRTRYKKHDLEWYLKTLPVLQKYSVDYRCVMDEFLSIADQDISKFIDAHQFNLEGVKFCKTNGDLLDCIKNSQNKEVVEIRELIEQGYTYRAIINYSVNANVYDRYEIKKKFEKHGAYSFR